MKIDGLVKGINITAPEQGIADNLLNRVAPGDVLRARIIETSGSQALLMLSDGTVMNASLLQVLNFKPGEMIDFIVTGRSDDRLVLETLKDKNDSLYISEQKNALENVLKPLNIKITGETLNAAAALRNTGLNISPELINKVSAGIKSFTGLTAEEAVFLLAAGMDINSDNVSALLQLTRSNYKIGENLHELNRLFQTLDRLLAANEPGSSSSNPGANSNITGFNTYTGTGAAAGANSMTNGANTAYISTDSAVTSTAALSNVNATTAANSSQSSTAGSSTISATGTDMTANTASGIAPANASSTVTVLEADVPVNMTAAEELIAADTSIAQRSDIIAASNTTSNTTSITTADIYTLSGDNLKEAVPITADVLTAGKKADLDEQEQSKAYNAPDLDDTFLKPEKSFSRENIKNTYKALLENLHSVRELMVQNAVTGRDEILARIDNLQNNIRFINDLNSYCTYFQIPVSLRQHNTTAQLYIMKKNKPSHNIDPENATLYISLDTLNLGQVDSLLKVEKKNVSLNLRAETPEMVSLFKSSGALIYKMLQSKGYRLVEYRCLVAEKPASILNVAEILQQEYETRNRTIDYRL